MQFISFLNVLFVQCINCTTNHGITYRNNTAYQLIHVEVVGSIGVLGVVLAAMLPLGATREAASRVPVPARLATASVLVGPVPCTLK